MQQGIAKLIGMYINVLAYVAPRYAGELGFQLFCTPRRAPLKNNHRQFLDTSERSSFFHDGYRIQVYRWGRGPKKVLFLHGWESHTYRWKNYIEALDHQEFSLYSFDAPGHGHSGGKYLNLPIYSQVLETFLQLAGPFDAIVSHSLGSFTALHTFHRIGTAPVNQLVVTGVPGEVSEFFAFFKKALGLSRRAEGAIRNAFKRILHQSPEYYSAQVFVQGLDVPGLIIHDHGDIETPIHHAEAIHRAWKESTLIRTNGLGHNLRSPHVVKQIVAFLDDKTRKASLPLPRALSQI